MDQARAPGRDRRRSLGRGLMILPRVAGEGDHAKRGGGGRRQGMSFTRDVTMRAPLSTVARARQLRRQLSLPEARLWSRLRARIPGLPAFRRQHPMGPYVLDFYCAKARLAIEIDGIAHDMGDRPQRDLRRQSWLEAQGITVLRIPASELARQFDETADAVIRMAIAMVETAAAPSTTLRVVPLPRASAGEEGRPSSHAQRGKGTARMRDGGGRGANPPRPGG
jgi:very-short-patch-repair endonuclease